MQLYYFNMIDIDYIDVVEIKRKQHKRIGGILERANTLIQSVNRKCKGRLLHFPILSSLYSILLKSLYGSWIFSIKDYNKIIVFDTVIDFDNSILSVISHLSNQSKYLYCWNTISCNSGKEWFLLMAKRNDFKVYSFDINDCMKYSLSYNSEPYYKDVLLPPKTDHNDVFFCGSDKKRMTQLYALYLFLNELDITTKIVIFNEKENIKGFEYRKMWMSYDEYLQNISNCDILIDINQNGQAGFSMRVMESVFFNRKLITSNPYVLEADFYNDSNIFYVDNFDSIDKERFIEFYKNDVIPYSSKIRDKYDIREWVKRFK